MQLLLTHPPSLVQKPRTSEASENRDRTMDVDA